MILDLMKNQNKISKMYIVNDCHIKKQLKDVLIDNYKYNYITKYFRNMNKELKKFYIKNKDTLIYYHIDLKGTWTRKIWYKIESIIEINKIDLKVVVEWIVKDIEKEDTQDSVDSFLLEFV